MKEVTISARIEERLRDELRKLAHQNDRTFSQEVRRALRLHVLDENGFRVKKGK